MLSPAVAMAAEVRCQRRPAGVHGAGLNITAGVASAEDSNQVNSLQPVFK